MYKLRLTNSILGWMLTPFAGSESIMDQLYLEEWSKMKPSERAFMKGEPIEKVIAHIKEVCKDLKIGLSLCGKKAGPTLRLWWNPITRIAPVKVSVDLKWSCWTDDKGIWDEYAPGVWEQMEAAFKGTSGPLEVNTGPRKEIRYGSITISKGQASGYFCTNWDECSALADTLGPECDDAFCEMIPHSIHMMEPGMDWEFTVKARKFASLIRQIDNQEGELLSMAYYDELNQKQETFFRDLP